MTRQRIGERSWTGRSLSVSWPAGPLTGVVLVLHGGSVSSDQPTAAWQPAVLRMTVLARAIALPLRPEGIAVARLRFDLRGWNGSAASPLKDAGWAIGQLRAEAAARAGSGGCDDQAVPMVLAGHSLGGRTAVQTAGAAGVTGVVALAPWLPPGEPVRQLAGRRLVIMHGDQDRVTDPRDSAAYAQRAEQAGAGVEFITVTGDGHAMLRKARLWHQLTAEKTKGLVCLGGPAGPGRPQEAAR